MIPHDPAEDTPEGCRAKAWQLREWLRRLYRGGMLPSDWEPYLAELETRDFGVRDSWPSGSGGRINTTPDTPTQP